MSKQQEAKVEDNAVMTVEAGGKELSPLEQQEVMSIFDIKQNMEGVDAKLPVVKIIHAAAMFKMPSGEMVKDFSGVILDAQRNNAFWAVSFDESGGGSPPNCFSIDGIKSSPLSDTRQNIDCMSCSSNAFGTDIKGAGKACKNMKFIHVLLPGDIMPVRLVLPPSNLKSADLFITLLSGKGIAYQRVITNFSLKIVQNKDGIKYSELMLSASEPSNDLQYLMKLKQIKDQWMPIMRGQSVSSSDL